MCSDPKDFRFCSYGEALGGSPQARAGIAAIAEVDDWQLAARDYRLLIFGKGAEPKSLGGGPITPKQMEAVIKAAGRRLPRAVLLRCKVRYFSDGAILGSRQFVHRVFAEYQGPQSRRRNIVHSTARERLRRNGRPSQFVPKQVFS